MKISKWVGILLLGLGLWLRLYQFGSIPTALNRDEAALGYNAFAISSSGMDEWGQRYPLIFKSFGDYKLPGYIYITAFFVNLFGVSDGVIRLPSLLAGLGIVWLTYAFARLVKLTTNQSLLMAGLMAIQPWAVFYSRMAFESNVSLGFLLFALYWLLSKHIWQQLIGIVFFMAAVLTYNTPLLLAPLFIFLFWLHPSLTRKQRIIASAGIILVSSFMVVLLAPVTLQKQAITILSDPTIIDQQAKAYSTTTTVFAKLWWHKEIYWLRLITDRFIASFSPSFLTMQGGANPWHTVPGGAHFYWITYTLVWLGFVLVFITKTLSKRWKLFVCLLLIGSLLPAVITVDAPHATRSLLFFWLLTGLAGWTLIRPTPWLKKFLFVLLLIEVGIWSWRYYSLFPLYRSQAWPVGLRQSLIATRGEKVALISPDTNAMADQLYIYPLLYWQVPPEVYVNTVSLLPPDNANMIRVSGFQGFRITSEATADEQVIERASDGFCYIK